MNDYERKRMREYIGLMQVRVFELEQWRGAAIECVEYFDAWCTYCNSREEPITVHDTDFGYFVAKWVDGDLVEWKAKQDRMYSEAMARLAKQEPQP
jgi:hypothetical protein